MSAITTEADIYQTLGLSRELEQKNENELVLEDFMELMVTELTHQDPFKPMDNTELATQISQFATVSGIRDLNSSFSDLSGSLISDQALQAATLVGRDVLVPVESGYLGPGGGINGVVGLDAPANNVVVRVTDSTGALVRELSLGARSAGEVTFNWDGMSDTGEYAPSGQYSISAQATVDGEETSPYTLLEARVSSVSLGAPGQGLALNLEGLGSIALSDVAEIH